MKQTGAGQKRYELENGIRAEAAGDTLIYDFAFTDDADLFQDAKVEVQIFGKRIEASILSIGPGSLKVSTSEDLGPTVARAVLLVDATALLEALKDRIEEVAKGGIKLNRAIGGCGRRKGVDPRCTASSEALAVRERSRPRPAKRPPAGGASPSRSLAASRQTPPFGVAPISARAIRLAHNRSPMTCKFRFPPSRLVIRGSKPFRAWLMARMGQHRPLRHPAADDGLRQTG